MPAALVVGGVDLRPISGNKDDQVLFDIVGNPFGISLFRADPVRPPCRESARSSSGYSSNGAPFSTACPSGIAIGARLCAMQVHMWLKCW